MVLCAGATAHGAEKGTQFHCLKFHLGSAGEPTICSHCYSDPYMKIPANNQVILNNTVEYIVCFQRAMLHFNLIFQ